MTVFLDRTLRVRVCPRAYTRRHKKSKRHTYRLHTRIQEHSIPIYERVLSRSDSRSPPRSRARAHGASTKHHGFGHGYDDYAPAMRGQGARERANATTNARDGRCKYYVSRCARATGDRIIARAQRRGMGVIREGGGRAVAIISSRARGGARARDVRERVGGGTVVKNGSNRARVSRAVAARARARSRVDDDWDGWGLGGVVDSCVLFSFFAKSERREPDDARDV